MNSSPSPSMEWLLLLFLVSSVEGQKKVDEYRWTYDLDAFGGPDFWGLVNQEWRMCKHGQAQSPINVDPSKLLFDPHLGRLSFDSVEVAAWMENTGQMPLISLNTSALPALSIANGPAMPYKYRLAQIVVHFGKADGGEKGSEHTVDRLRFPAEIQLLAYNTDLYDNFTQAMTQPRGLLAIAVIVDIGRVTEPELRRITVASQSITYKGSKTVLPRLRPSALLPRTHHYVTYEGSLTYPGCHETVTWIIMNNPIYITREDLAIWNELQQSETKLAMPQLMNPVYRPLKALNGRLLRTNINVSMRPREEGVSCPAPVYSELGYRANPSRHNGSHHHVRRDVEGSNPLPSIHPGVWMEDSSM